MVTPITAFYAGLLAVIMLYLAFLVSMMRKKTGIGLGSARDKALLQLSRAHANFTEYVPMALILMLIGELNGVRELWLHLAGTILLFSRLIHAYGVRHHSGYSWQRFYGTLGTFLVIAGLIWLDINLVYR
ncbi:MAPEG family protein [Aliiglaciecola sp. CAU 1673]|uniref:MAPEG family protein n=1 Tax=Aliiglaciecola sp. CAU 1673 TaxID=3032595 RepID=UPI0023DC7974|nr:MAPEG family protein [Aliiglaciecola sp. CAU 1673]MDF2179552.1 MAPEG family protein [Aliiglaciecola sp. CAU 1673]